MEGPVEQVNPGVDGEAAQTCVEEVGGPAGTFPAGAIEPVKVDARAN